MSPLTNNLFRTMTRLDGCKIRAFLTTPIGFKKDDMYNRVLVVRRPVLVVLGDIVITPGGVKVLLTYFPDDDEWRASFRANVVNAEYAWERTIKSLDPVAKVMRDFQNVPMGTIYAYFDTPGDTKIGLMHDTKYSFYTGQDVIEGDIVGGKIVKKVVDHLGVKLVNVE